MTSERRPIPFLNDASMLSPGDVHERRAQAKREQELLLAERQQRLGEITSADKTPEDRIKLWEQAYALRLPRDRSHKLIRVIARQTGLSVAQVHEEQLRRGAPR
jgi:hypothetical protein